MLLNIIQRANSISYLLDTCQGGSGGPLMYYSENEQVWVLAGITSYGRGCGLPDYAGVYTRVSMYVDWIQSIVGDDGIVTIPQNKANIYSMSNLIVIHIYRSKICNIFVLI
jgi:secreted trypsin-like serine protease